MSINLNIKTVIKSSSGHIFVDTDNNILNLIILNKEYNKEEFTSLCVCLKEFFNQAFINKKKYYLIFDVRNIGVYPLYCYEQVKKNLEELKNILPYVLHSTCVLVEPNLTAHILNFFFKIYKPVRPAKIITSLDQSMPFFNENMNTAVY